MGTVEVRQYQTADGRIPFAERIAALRDRRANRHTMKTGNVAGLATVADRAAESGASERTQTKDIERARDYWKDYQAHR